MPEKISSEAVTTNEASGALTRKTEDGLLALTEAGRERLTPLVTSVDADVYAFTREANSTMVAAAGARLSRSPDDLRTILASEFLSETDPGKYEQLLQRVVNNYGDDSVMQLDSMQVVFEGISNLATKEIEDGRVAVGYLEQSTRYLRFDRRDEDGNYRYYSPEEFDDATKTEYRANTDEIFDIYSSLYGKIKQHIMDNSSEEVQDAAWRQACHAQACDSIRSILPVATKATVEMTGSMQSIYNLIIRLEAERLPEFKKLHTGLLKAARAVALVFFDRVDNPERGGLISANKEQTHYNSRDLAAKLAEKYGIEQEHGTYVKLVGVSGSEDETLAKILADHSEFPISNWLEILNTATEAEKAEIIDVYVGERFNRRVKPGRAYEMPHYLFEIQGDVGSFRDIHRSRLTDGFTKQRFQPYLGHDRPKIIDEAGLVDEYERAFEISTKTYEMLMERGYEEQAQYAVLFGNNMRYSFKVNARSFIHSAELRTTPQGHPSYRKIYQEMAALVTDAHPNLFRVMKFLNKNEDPELARIGAERARQAKEERQQLANATEAEA